MFVRSFYALFNRSISQTKEISFLPSFFFLNLKSVHAPIHALRSSSYATHWTPRAVKGEDGAVAVAVAGLALSFVICHFASSCFPLNCHLSIYLRLIRSRILQTRGWSQRGDNNNWQNHEPTKGLPTRRCRVPAMFRPA